MWDFCLLFSFIYFSVIYSPAQLTDDQKEMLDWTDESPAKCTLHVNKAICILSHHPFGDTFEKWLRFIYVSLGCLFCLAIPQPDITISTYFVFFFRLFDNFNSFFPLSLDYIANVTKWYTVNRTNWTIHYAIDWRSSISSAKYFNSIIEFIERTNHIDTTGRFADATQRSRFYAIAHQFRTR